MEVFGNYIDGKIDKEGEETTLLSPVEVEPVKLNALIFSLFDRVVPTTEPSPVTTLSTPGGSPAELRSLASSNAVAGV